jgi:lipid A 3-O-deacylase
MSKDTNIKLYNGETIMRKFCLLILITIFLLIVGPTNAFGYLENRDTQFETELEYFSPLHEKNRDIDTISLNLQKVDYADDFISVHSGLIITRAWGDMTRRDVYSKCDAYGIGPSGLIRLRLMGLNFLGYSGGDVVELSFDMSGAVIFWNKNFPTNGDFYDFMWQVGPKLSCLIGERTVLNIGYKWMHVSNGQWEWHNFCETDFKATNSNPSYNAKGITLTIVNYF